MARELAICAVLLACTPLVGQNEAPPSNRADKSEWVEMSVSGRNICGYEVVDDGSGIELGTYGNRLVEAVREKWYSIIASSLKAPEKPRTTVIDFLLREDGEIGKIRVEESSGDKSLDTMARDAVPGIAPFPSRIPNFPSKPVELRFCFEYNREPSAHRPFCGTTPQGVYRVGGSVEAPRILYQPDPEDSEEAR